MLHASSSHKLINEICVTVDVCAGRYLVLVCGVELVPWLRVTGLVPAEHKNLN